MGRPPRTKPDVQPGGKATFDGWAARAACLGKPPQWWDLGDGGNRLALLICRRACPVLAQCRRYEPQPTGVIRSGIAWTDWANRAEICTCGQPIVPDEDTGRSATACATCRPKDIPLPSRRFCVRAADRLIAEDNTDTIRDLAAAGHDDSDIATAVGCTARAVRAHRDRHAIPGRARAYRRTCATAA